MKAEVILMKCPEVNRIYGVRVEERYDDWFRTWAFPIDERRASHEGFDRNEIKGNLDYTDDYNGCPYCKSKRIRLDVLKIPDYEICIKERDYETCEFFKEKPRVPEK